MNKKIVVIVSIIIVLALGVFAYNYFQPKTDNTSTQAKIGNGILIGFSLGTLQEERWQRDKVEFLKKADELGAVVDFQSSNNNTAQQISQIESMILKGVNVLVVVPYDANSLKGV